jgi:hypothetical protein
MDRSDERVPGHRVPGSPTASQSSRSDLGLWWRIVFGVLSVACVLPLFRAELPPLQDLPQHLAAVRVLRSHPELGLGQYFDVELFRTQYLTYYLTVWLLSYPFGILLASKLVIAATLAALPWSLASLLRALGRDPRLAVFAFGLAYNAHLVLGFFNFVAALPLMFYAITRAVDYRRTPTRREATVVALLLVACFYTHVVPFAFAALGVGLVLLGGGLVPSLRRGFLFVPAALAAIIWLHGTPAGGATLSAAGGGDGDKAPQYASVNAAIKELPMWLTDVLAGTRDEQLLVAWGALLLCAMALGLRRPPEHAHFVPEHPSEHAYRVALLAPLALVAYFVTPVSYDWIWPISARFPLIALLFAVLLLPPARGFFGSATLAAVGFVAFLGFSDVARAFATFERDEVGAIDEAIAAIPAGERVAGLIFDRGSREVKFSPFIHYAAMYQAAKGGAVMFTFADFPQSPFRFKDANRPPRVSPRWEWLPEKVDPARDLAWYRFVLVRGSPGRIARDAEHFEKVFSGPRWTVWRRK